MKDKITHKDVSLEDLRNHIEDANPVVKAVYFARLILVSALLKIFLREAKKSKRPGKKAKKR